MSLEQQNMKAIDENTKSTFLLKELKTKTKDFLKSPKYANNLIDIMSSFEECINERKLCGNRILFLEIIFRELLKRRELCIEVTPLKPKDNTPKTVYKEWLQARYEETLNLLYKCMESEKTIDSVQALVTCMKLMSIEGQYPIDYTEVNCFPQHRLRKILLVMLSMTKKNERLFQRFKEYTEYLDIVFYTWKILYELTSKAALADENFAHNFLEIINTLPVTKEVYESKRMLCFLPNKKPSQPMEYMKTRKCINKVWDCIMQWCKMKESLLKQVLIVLLERIMPHLDKPILLTDLLMDSLDYGGPIALLALQGIFILIQKHNITYPNIYEKLYSMFEPEIFHTKFKARLFYLTDIFLSSTHLPENLVAAFVKRLARLSLIAPPQDAIIILYFIGNLILRHSGLKRLICSETALEVSSDPYVMEERDPTKSKALESSLWEIVTLQKHAVPAVATAAKFISQPLPNKEWDLSSHLEINESDIFDQEISKNTKQYALTFERPLTFFLPKNDKVAQYWKLF